jgi:glycosyltransferase involved in cell wall biosynthesis
MANIPRPILGYFGAMDYVMDTDLMAEVARLRPEWHWVMLGLKSNLVQVSAPNIHFLGSQPYADLPKFVKCFDVCVLPWRQDNAFTSYGSAIKVREYLATGKPVVISPLYEYLNTPGVRIYRSTEEFVAQVEDALQNDSAEAKQQRQAAVQGCDWNLRTRQVSALIESLKKGEKYAYEIPLAKAAQI